MSEADSQAQEQPAAALRRAQDAAVAGDPVGMVEALYESHALDGLIRTMRSRWDGIPSDEVESIVAAAVAVLYEDVRDGEKILNIGAYLYRIADNKAHQYYDARQREAAAAEDFHHLNSQEQNVDVDLDLVTVDEEEEGASYEERRAWACNMARSLLPKIGQKNIQNVMTLIIEAVESGRAEISNVEIAGRLNIPAATVRQLRKRGFERLAQRAREAGIMERGISFTNLGDGQRQNYPDIIAEG